MPSSNQTNISSNTNSTTSLSNHTSIRTNTSAASWYDPAGNLGYGIGRLLKGAFDSAWNAYQTWWNPVPSQAEIAHQKQIMIYRQGLEECVTHLDRAIDNLRKNPNDPQSLKRIEKLISHYAVYVHPAKDDVFKKMQQQQFQDLESKLARLIPPSLQKKARGLIPALFSQSIETAVNKELFQSQQQEVEQTLSVSSNHLEKASSVKSKRAIAVTQQFPASFDLNSLDGTNGFTVPSVSSSGLLGVSVSTAGDINGDNIMDLVLSAPYANSNSGAVYVIFGSRGKFTASFSLNTLNGTNGFMIPAATPSGYLGWSVSTAGDINGDNLTDLVLGAPDANADKGTAYVICKRSRNYIYATLWSCGRLGLNIPR